MGRDKGASCSAVRTGFSVAQLRRKECLLDQECKLQPEQEGLDPEDLSKQPPPHHSQDNKEALSSPKTQKASHSPLQAVPLQVVSPEQGMHSPLQAVPLVQGAQGSIWVLVMKVDGGSHQQEGGVGHLHTPAHLSVQLCDDGVPVKARHLGPTVGSSLPAVRRHRHTHTAGEVGPQGCIAAKG